MVNSDFAFSLAILLIDAGEPEKIISFLSDHRFFSEIRWAPDQKEILYIVNKEGYSNIWPLPLDGSEPKQITYFDSDSIYNLISLQTVDI